MTMAVASIYIELTTPACPLKGQIKSDVESVIREIPEIKTVERKAYRGKEGR